MTTIGLAMIAKDEAAVITRALDSVTPLVDYVLIEDTGSSDGTQQIVRDWLGEHGIDGLVIDVPWRDFAHNRSHVLAQLRLNTQIDYALMLDADDVLRIHSDPADIKASLAADCYTIDIHHGGMIHQRPHITNNRKPFRYRGVLHEFLECPEPNSQAHLESLSIHIVGGGVHSRNPVSMRHDATLLQKALNDPSRDRALDTRYRFYLAQSWRDCGEDEKALINYLQRAEMGGWFEEVYISLLNAARAMERLDRPLPLVVGAYLKASLVAPTRAEAIHAAARCLRLNNMFHESTAIAQRGIALPVYRGLFAEEWIYRWGLLDEFSISAYYAERYAESYLAADLILKRCNGEDLNPANLKRIQENREFARAKLTL